MHQIAPFKNFSRRSMPPNSPSKRRMTLRGTQLELLKTIRLGPLQYSTVQYSTVQYSTVQYSTVQLMIN